MKTAKYVRTSTASQSNKGIDEQSQEFREFAIALEAEEIRAKELLERTKQELLERGKKEGI